MTIGGTQAGCALLALLALAACGAEGDAPARATAIPAPVAAPLVERVVDWQSYAGRFEASRRVEVRARVGGYLEGVHFRDGQQVAEGDLLFTIDPRPYLAAVEAAESEVARTRAAVGQLERDVERARRLAASNTVSEQTLESARSALEQGQASQAAAEAALRARQLDLEFTRIASPIAGRVSDRRVDAGNLVAAGGETLTTVVATDPIYFLFDAPESALIEYQRQAHDVGEAVIQVRLQGESEHGREGRVVFADNVVDPVTGTLRLRGEIPNPDGFLRPGMFGDARVAASATYQAILVPQTAVLADATRRIVYALDESDVVQARVVTLGPLSDDLWVVLAGLTPEDRIVVKGLQRLRPGVVVAPEPAEIARASAGGAVLASGAPAGATAAPAQ